MNYTLIETHDGEQVIVHDPFCLEVQAAREAGHFVATLFGCTSPLPPDMKRHECLKEERPA